MESIMTQETGDQDNDKLWYLIVEARLGNERAFEGLFAHPKLMNMVTKISTMLVRSQKYNSYRDAEDLCQEVLLKLLMKITTFEGHGIEQFWSWLLSLAKHLHRLTSPLKDEKYPSEYPYENFHISYTLAHCCSPYESRRPSELSCWSIKSKVGNLTDIRFCKYGTALVPEIKICV